jgi:hypothetical protein
MISHFEHGNESLRFIEYCRFIGSEVITVAVMMDTMGYNVVWSTERQSGNQHGAGSKQNFAFGLLLGLFFNSEVGGYVSLYQLTFSGLHGIVSKKTELC